MTRIVSLSLTALALTAALGCGGATTRGSLPTGTLEPDKFLFDKGTTALEARKWLTAREYFKQVVETYTGSVYRPDAKIGIGDTYLGEGTSEALVLAINEFREFLTYYPTITRSTSCRSAISGRCARRSATRPKRGTPSRSSTPSCCGSRTAT
jgi:outer membrane protein assembly factor BamD (BamD/ComL family)